MNFVLTNPRYVGNITYSKDTPTLEKFVFDATVDSPYKLIVADQGLLLFGSVQFHRMPKNQEPNAQFMYLEPEPYTKHSEIGTFHCDIPVEVQLFDRWITLGIMNQNLSLVLNFGFMPPAGLKYGVGADGWQSQTWSVESNRVLMATEISLISRLATSSLAK